MDTGNKQKSMRCCHLKKSGHPGYAHAFTALSYKNYKAGEKVFLQSREKSGSRF